MNNQRLETVCRAGKAEKGSIKGVIPASTESFGKLVFNRKVMERMLPKDVFKNIQLAILGKEPLDLAHADTIALAMKEWAMEHGASHYTHWFQPLTGASAEKHDAFINWLTLSDQLIDHFGGKELIQGEPDASSFPSGGLRSTYEARGYTGWDPSSPPFLWKGGDGYTLCIPSVFFSWHGQALDWKIPLLRSDQLVNLAVKRLLNITGIKVDHVFSTLGLEQEYFVIERSFRNLRPDLLILGKTVIGAPPPKGQEMQDHYFGSVKDRILSFMRDFEERALELGIPVKTRHNEVAPAQHEVAPIYERTTLAIDHNLILMELMRQAAHDGDLSLLLHEKPFAGLNGSGKHSNWSLQTSEGLNLLDPSEVEENNLHFLILLVAILHGIHRHHKLLRASIGSASNDDRLGGHEAPPAIISVYLGQELEALLDGIEKGDVESPKKGAQTYDLGLNVIPPLKKDQTDRNRTSPFAFTGNKFEYRAVGSSQNPSLPMTVLNAVVAESLGEILDQLEPKAAKAKSSDELINVTKETLKPFIKASHPIRFSGDNYSQEWQQEAKNRGLEQIANSVEAFSALIDESTFALFEKILTPDELQSRYEVALEHYINQIDVESKLLIELFKTNALPVAIRCQKERAESILAYQKLYMGKGRDLTHQLDKLTQLSELIESAILDIDFLESVRNQALNLPLHERAMQFSTRVRTQCLKSRHSIDQLEALVDDALWTLPKYRELLWLV